MIKKTFILILCCIQFALSAQDYKFGKVSKEELKEQFYPLDSTADAAYLYRHRKTYYEYDSNNGLEIFNEFTFRVKLYSKAGFKYGNFAISYVNPEKGDSEKINSIKAYTYNLNEKGKVEKTKLQKSDIFDEKVSKFRHLKKITMPNLKEGAVIELTYTLKSPYINYIDDLDFQFAIPVKKFSATIESPEWLIFAKKNKGFYAIEAQESKYNSSISFKQKVRTTTTYVERGGGGKTVSSAYEYSSQDVAYNVSKYEANNIPALKDDEPFVSNIQKYRGGITYELVGTRYPNSVPKNFSNSWENVTKQIFKSDNFGGELAKNNYFKDDIDALIADANSNNERIAAIFEFVKRRVKWNGYYNKYTNKGVKNAYKEKEGNSAEINLMLTAMLRYANLNAYPVLISSKNNGVPLFPTLKGFDNVITLVQFADNSYILMDATEPFSVPNVLPARDLNWNGRVVTKDGGSSWVKLTTAKHALEENIVMVKITEDATIEGLIRTKFDNLNALSFRKNNNHLKEEELIEKFEEKNIVEVEDFKVVNRENLGKPVSRNVKFISEDLIEEINGKLYIEPLLFLSKNTNPFKLEERKFPVDFSTAWKDVNRVTIQIPEGYQVETTPEPIAIGLPDNIGVFKFQVTARGNKINTISILEFNEALIGAQYYPFLKDFYGKLVQKESEKIVLTKI